jgi:hypothetical protein
MSYCPQGTKGHGGEVNPLEYIGDQATHLFGFGVDDNLNVCVW